MNILISNGSPRKKGLISQMLNIMQAEAETRGDKLLFDRIVYGMMRDTPRFPEPLMKGKKCILLSTCTTPWPQNILFKQSRGATRAMCEICRYSDFKIVSTIERGGTAVHPQLSEKDRQKCLKAINRI